MSINIHKTLPDELQKRILPSWFNMDLFTSPDDKLKLSDREWRDRASQNEYHIMRSEGTEKPFDNEYYDTVTEGVYICRACSNPLFSSTTKFHSNSGWPSYFAPIAAYRIGVKQDYSLLTERTEVHCARCDGHLGHVFDDGPEPTGLRYCINSQALRLIDESSHKKISEGREDELDFSLNR